MKPEFIINEHLAKKTKAKFPSLWHLKFIKFETSITSLLFKDKEDQVLRVPFAEGTPKLWNWIEEHLNNCFILRLQKTTKYGDTVYGIERVLYNTTKKHECQRDGFFDVYITGVSPTNKIDTIKLTRYYSSMSLKDAKDFVEGSYRLNLPIVSNVSPDYAELIIREFINIGASAEAREATL